MYSQKTVITALISLSMIMTNQLWCDPNDTNYFNEIKKLLGRGSTGPDRETIEVVMGLIGALNDVNIKDNIGNTPLHEAVLVGSNALVMRLIKLHANVNVKNNDGLTPLMVTTTYPAETAEANYLAPIIIDELIKAGADLNLSDSEGRTALMMAAYNTHYKIVKELLDARASVDVRDKYGKTVLQVAQDKLKEMKSDDPLFKVQEYIIATLIKAGAKMPEAPKAAERPKTKV